MGEPANRRQRSRFVERAGKCDRVIVGTPLYREKYENDEPMRGYVAGTRLGGAQPGDGSLQGAILPARVTRQALEPAEFLPPPAERQVA
jgi:hypothetical protein